ncbi:DEAD/DEAH box helicase [Streptococcus ferus]|uniref:DEAD/DEAH box helicase n=1 Tax=Streptococcus ferus TaxID=1345 RepID=UPI00359F837A
MERLEQYCGRLLTADQLPAAYHELAQKMPAMTKKSGHFFCNRCAGQVENTHRLPDGSFYCRACLVFGRLTSKDSLYWLEQKAFPAQQALLWEGQLTAFQQEVSDALLAGIQEKMDLLVHAVTGAGKTEMIYETIAHVISQGGSVALASPRIDVCLELHRRLQKDFACPISLLHGQSEAYERAPLLIATTHQLIKFYQAFDLLIIDEVDAFPFVDNPMLYHALNQSLKTDGVKIFLTATSTQELDRQVKKGQLKKINLARRFHANPLVVPKTVWLPSLIPGLKKRRLPKTLLKRLQVQRKTGFPLLLFFPNIDRGQAFAECLQEFLPNDKIAFVSSRTESRLDKVEAFRKKEIDILVSTTILERGVTFPCVDVFVLEANHRLFTKSALVQISGRTGRSIERPTGELLFFHDGLTTAIQQTISEIKEMNRRGGF